MADEQTTPEPVVDNPVPDPSVPPEISQPTEAVDVPVPTDPAAQTQDPAQLAADFKKDELQAAAAVQGVDVPASATKADIAQAIVEQAPASTPGVVVDNLTKRSDNDTLLGGWLDVVSGEYTGRFGSYVATVTHDSSGYPESIIVRTRDADNLLIEVAYSDTRPSDRNGGR